MNQKQLGFTLIELMVTVAIVGILAGIAYPSYQDSVRKSRREDAKGVLLGLANAMERNFTTATAIIGYCDVGGAGGASSCGTATNDTGTPSIYTIPTATATYYTVTISAATASSYTLSAAPTGAQASDSCGTLTLDQTGAKTPTTSGCW